MVRSCHRNTGQYQNLLTANKFFESVAKFKYFKVAFTKKLRAD